MSRRKDEAIYEYCLAHAPSWERSADTVARALGMEEYELRARVHQSDRLKMRGICLGWHVIEVVAPAASQEIKHNKGLVADGEF